MISMRICNLLAVVLLVVFGGVKGEVKGDRVLVVLEKKAQEGQHSILLSSLKDEGLKLEIALSSETGVKLKEWDEYKYDHLILLTPRVAEFSQSFSVRDVLEFVDGGGNVVVAADTGFSKKIGELAQECGVDLDKANSKVYDHISFAQGLEGSGLPNGDPTLVAADVSRTKKIWGDAGDMGPILFKGVAVTIPPDSEYAVPGLLAPHTSYSLGKKEKLNALEDPVIGHDISMVSLVQARNNARVVVFGSLSMLSDKFFQAKFKVWSTGKTYQSSGNKDFSLMAMLWACQRRGVLSVSDDDVKHWERTSQMPKEIYRVNDDMHFEVGVFEERNGERVPFKDGKNAQLEYIMLDPYIRTNLQESHTGSWAANFKAPDVYGVFKFVMQYRRPGYSYIDIVRQAPIRPYKHNEFDRFLVSAYPYYVSCFSMMIGFFLLGRFFLYQK